MRRKSGKSKASQHKLPCLSGKTTGFDEVQSCRDSDFPGRFGYGIEKFRKLRRKQAAGFRRVRQYGNLTIRQFDNLTIQQFDCLKDSTV